MYPQNQMRTVRVLAVSDLWQNRRQLEELRAAVTHHRPDCVAFVGDILAPKAGVEHASLSETARQLALLPAEHLVFLRGENERENWLEFRHCWPHADRPLVALHGTAHAVGPLVIVGFPCRLGSDASWRRALPKQGNVVLLDPFQSGRKRLPRTSAWLPQLLEQWGQAGRSLWLMHEPPVKALANDSTYNPVWGRAVQKHRPLLVVSGHDRHAPVIHRKWLSQIGASYCVNPGQGLPQLSYSVAEFSFESDEPSLATTMLVEVFPWGTEETKN